MSVTGLSELPEGWAWASIGDVTEGIEKRNPADDPNREIKYIDITSIDNSTNQVTGHKTYLGKDAPSRARQVLQPGDILFSTVRTYLHNVAVTPDGYGGQFASTGFSVLRGKNGILSKYLFFYSLGQDLNNRLANIQRGTSYPAIRDRDMREQPIPVAPTNVQRRIVAKIEELFSQLDAGVTALKVAQAKLKRYKASVLKAACEGRLVPTEAELARKDGREYEPASVLLERIAQERGQEWKLMADTPYELPEGWAWARLDQLTDVKTGATPLRGKKKYWSGGTIPWVRSGAMNSVFVEKAEEFITEIALKETNAKFIPAGSLLIAMYGEGATRGKISELTFEAATNQAIASLIFSQETLPLKAYIKLFFRMNYEDLRRKSSGGVQPNLNLSIIRRTAIPLPPKDEQIRIVEAVERNFSIVNNLSRIFAELENRGSRLRMAILSVAFQGNLVA